MDCTWYTVILLPKGRCEYQGIGLVGVLWKVISIIIDRRLAESIELYDFLHMFRVWRGTFTATLEAKILQEIMGMRKEVLYEIFIVLHKANDSI